MGYPPQHHHWYGGWHPHAAYHYGDDNSVQSGLSGETFAPQPYDMNMYPAAMHHPQYFHPHAHMYPPPGMYNPAMQQPGYAPEAYAPEQYNGMAWSEQIQGDKSLPEGAPTDPGTPIAHVVEESPIASYPPSTHYGEQPTPQTQLDGAYKCDEGSPYWGHLDHGAFSLLASPQGMAGPETPSRPLHASPEGTGTETGEDTNGTAVGAQPLLLRQQHYPSYGYHINNEGYGPPSPATQFMMSPQANFAYGGYGAYGGYSPNRTSSPSQSSPVAPKGAGAMPAAPAADAPNAMSTPSKATTGIQTDAGASEDSA
jgi:hypothetical protein